MKALYLKEFRRWSLVIISVLLLAAVWKYTPLKQYLSKESLAFLSDYAASTKYPVLTVIISFVAASLVLFPVMAMIVLCCLALPPLQAIFAAFCGVALSSFTGYLAGRLLGPKRVEHLLGPIYRRVREKVQKNTFWSVVVIRHLPLGPFTVVNLVLGSMHLSLPLYLLANSVSLLPSVIAASLIGGYIQNLIHKL